MATIKLKFRASSVPGAEGTLYYQVIHKRNVKWISTGYHVFRNEWDEKAATLRRAEGRTASCEVGGSMGTKAAEGGGL